LTINWEDYILGLHEIEVSFESEFGCEAEAIVYAVTTVECDNSTLYTPNSFTPGRKENNVWMPLGYNWKSIHCMVFNRWGDMIFETYDGNKGWDGTHNGYPCQDGVYVYKIEWIDNKNKKNISYGHITLLR
jgi:gliding motility-associated-like protein